MYVEALQCPECNLRFVSSSELDDHIAVDHPDFHIESRSVEDSLLGAARRRRHAPSYRPNRSGNSS